MPPQQSESAAHVAPADRQQRGGYSVESHMAPSLQQLVTSGWSGPQPSFSCAQRSGPEQMPRELQTLPRLASQQSAVVRHAPP
jgi:hypothetical protein